MVLLGANFLGDRSYLHLIVEENVGKSLVADIELCHSEPAPFATEELIPPNVGSSAG